MFPIVSGIIPRCLWIPRAILPKADEKDSLGTVQTQDDTATTKADGDTQLYYVYNEDKLIVAWRGTASLFDVGTDLAFRPVKSELCDIDKTQCTPLLPAGKVHTGFWSGYNRVEKNLVKKFQNLNNWQVSVSYLFVAIA
jgi:hypothetical protein